MMPNIPDEKPANAAETPRRNGRVRSRRRDVDGRTRGARRWRSLYSDFTARTGGKHAELCASLASVILQREQLDAALVRGEPVDAALLVKLSGEIRRLMGRLGLDADAPGDDMTQAALAASREQLEVA